MYGLQDGVRTKNNAEDKTSAVKWRRFPQRLVFQMVGNITIEQYLESNPRDLKKQAF